MQFSIYPFNSNQMVSQPITSQHGVLANKDKSIIMINKFSRNHPLENQKEGFLNSTIRPELPSRRFIENIKMPYGSKGGVAPPPPPPPPSSNPPAKKMLWGEPTWFFLHTISHKVKEESFYIIKKDLLSIMYSICSNLPCPDCASHAKDHLNSINFNSIQTKEQLKLMFFHFHNLVNQKKHFPEFPITNLDEKYSKANLQNIINHFIKYYTNASGAIRMLSEDFHRKQIVENMIKWLNRNFKHFDF